MVKGIHIIKYRKLENMELEFSKGINVLSGTNGTCKTSLLHIISNAFQAVTKKCEWLTDASCLDVIRQVNNMTNPKIESLTKGDKTHNDPANGIKGTIFSVDNSLQICRIIQILTETLRIHYSILTIKNHMVIFFATK